MLDVRQETHNRAGSTDLGDGEEVLGNINNVLHLLDGRNAVGHSLGVLLAGSIEETLDVL